MKERLGETYFQQGPQMLMISAETVVEDATLSTEGNLHLKGEIFGVFPYHSPMTTFTCNLSK